MNATPRAQRRLYAWVTLTSLMLLLMEGTLEATWYRAIFNPSEFLFRRNSYSATFPWLETLAVVMIILAGTYLLALGLARLPVKSWARPAIFLPWLAACIAASLKVLIYPLDDLSVIDMFKASLAFITDLKAGPAGFLHIVVIGLLVWRAVSLARTPPVIGQVLASFQVGLVWFLIYGMGFAFRHPVESTAGFSLFLFSGLFAMSMARIASLDDFLLEHSGRFMPRYGSGWLLFTLAASLLVVGLALLLAWLVSGQLVALAVRLVALLLTLVTALLLILLSPVILFLWKFMPSLAEILKQAFARLMQLELPPFVEDFVNQVVYLINQSVPYLLEGRKLLLAGIVLAIMAAILFSLRRAMSVRLLEENGEANGSGASLSSLLQRILQLRPDWKARRMRAPAQVLAAARIRQIYRSMMILSRRLGHERPPAQTPLEFLPRLEALFPGESAGLNTITQAYVKVRYGKYPETLEEVRAVEAAWERIRRKKLNR